MEKLEIETDHSATEYDEDEEVSTLLVSGATGSNGHSNSNRFHGFQGGGQPQPVAPSCATAGKSGGSSGRRSTASSVSRWFPIGVLVLFSLVGLYLSRRFLLGRKQNRQAKMEGRDEFGVVHYPCPTFVHRAENIDSNQAEWYDRVSQKINVTEYLDVFRNTEFDNWGKSYEEVKSGMRHWKSARFAGLEDNSSVYESGSGIGMNLFMTLEILAEMTDGPKRLVVHGNDYSVDSIRVAVQIARRMALPGDGRLGTLCPGDSTDLYFVPSDSFDAVYSGYVVPLLDPLGFNQSAIDNESRYAELCEERDSESAKRNALAQKRQNDWYAKWVGEMIRIARPGAPVMVEQVSYPLCEALFDWGGVNPQFWNASIEEYGWDVDPSSIDTEEDTIFRKRYHVFMRKNGPRLDP